MKLVHPAIDTHFDLTPGQSWELIIEDQSSCVKLVHELIRQRDGDDGSWVLSENGHARMLSRFTEVIVDPFSLAPHKNRRVINRLHEQLSLDAISEDYSDETDEIISRLRLYGERLIDFADLSFELCTANELDVRSLLRALEIAPAFDANTLLELWAENMRMLRDLLGVRILVSVGIRTFFSDIELAMVCANLAQDGIALLDIESRDFGGVEGMQRCVIDDQFGEF